MGARWSGSQPHPYKIGPMPRATVCLRVAIATTALAACARSSAPVVEVSHAGGDALPFDPAAVQARLAAEPQNAACNGFDEGTLGVLINEQREMVIEAGGAVDESFACRPLVEAAWECTWEVLARPRDAACTDAACCYQIVVRVDRMGAFAPDDIACQTPD